MLSKNVLLNWYSSMKNKLRKIQIIFDIENWLWKSEIGIFQSLDLEWMLIWQIFFYEKVLFFTQFDAEVDEKFLNVIYFLLLMTDLRLHIWGTFQEITIFILFRMLLQVIVVHPCIQLVPLIMWLVKKLVKLW